MKIREAIICERSNINISYINNQIIDIEFIKKPINTYCVYINIGCDAVIDNLNNMEFRHFVKLAEKINIDDIIVITGNYIYGMDCGLFYDRDKDIYISELGLERHTPREINCRIKY